MAARSGDAVSPGVFFYNNGGGQKITEAGADTCFTKQVQRANANAGQ